MIDKLTKSESWFKLTSDYCKRDVVLRVWKDLKHAYKVDSTTEVIYMRLGHPTFSVPFTKETYYYVQPNEILDALLNLGEFTIDIKHENEVLSLLRKLKQTDFRYY